MIRAAIFAVALGQTSITNAPIEVYKSVKATISKITLSGKILQTCMTPIPSNRLQVLLFYVPSDASKREQAAKEPVTRFDPEQGKFSRIVEVPEGDYRIKVMNLRDDKAVADQRLAIGSKDIDVDLLVDCGEKK